MRKIYQLKKTSWWIYDDEKSVKHYLENDDYSEEFYTTLAKAEMALENYVRLLVGKVNGKYPNPWTIIKLFPRKHFIIEKSDNVGVRNYTIYTKWELIEIEPW